MCRPKSCRFSSREVYVKKVGDMVLLVPKNKIWVPIPFVVPLPAFTVVILLAILEFALGFLGLEEGIANFGHFGGIITGIILTYYWKKTSKPKTADERRSYEFFWE